MKFHHFFRNILVSSKISAGMSINSLREEEYTIGKISKNFRGCENMGKKSKMISGDASRIQSQLKKLCLFFIHFFQ